VTHDHAHGPEVQALGVVDVEEGRLQDARGKDDLVLGGRVVGVHRLRGHAPIGLVHRLVEAFQVALQIVDGHLDVVLEVGIRCDVQLGVLLVQLDGI